MLNVGAECTRLLRGTILNRTYGTRKNYILRYFYIFTNNIWSYLLCSPAVDKDSQPKWSLACTLPQRTLSKLETVFITPAFTLAYCMPLCT